MELPIVSWLVLVAGVVWCLDVYDEIIIIDISVENVYAENWWCCTHQRRDIINAGAGVWCWYPAQVAVPLLKPPH